MAPIRFRRFSVLLPLALAACTNAGPAAASPAAAGPRGVDLGGSGPVAASRFAPPAAIAGAKKAAPADGMQMAHDAHGDVHATGMVNSVDPAAHKVNLTHEAIPQIGWPSMTMDFAVAPNVDLRAIRPGARVDFSMEKDQGGIYQIRSIAPVGQ